MAQDFTASMREEWTREHTKILGLYSPAAMLSGKIAEGVLRANGGNAYKYLELEILEGEDIDAYSEPTFQDSDDTITTLTLSHTSQYNFRQEEDEEGRYQAFDSFRATHFKASILEHFRKTNGEFYFQAFISATNVYDDGDILSGTAGNPIIVSQTNIDELAFELSAALEEDGQEGGGFAISLVPRQIAKLNLAAFANGSRSSDDAFHGKLNLGIEGAFVGEYFETDFFKTTLIPTGQELTYTGLPTDGEAFTFNGVTLTAKNTLTGGDGEFKIEAGDDDTYTNLTTLCNNPALNNAAGKGWTKNGANYRKMRYAGAKQNTTDGIVTVVSKRGQTTLSEGLANATLDTQILYFSLLTRKGAIEMASPRGVRLTNGTNNVGTTFNHASRQRFGTAVPSQNLPRFAIIKTALAA